ncbi:hypothetical protein D8Y22_13045 [Salinadaptatus halalkaliphilus]|uniref:Uncharacterized protein n=1 Tax=Salinadaptatus halalkaliphilus TaxID=2419781 RepID=A0A4S3TK11_9EURY|nr:hypothetical protein [Salinadaptatus halalkaliphilus]THE64336.1 hypothetical protein D8Y22_13045 [Salinadaptatus halalkaliphilus]
MELRSQSSDAADAESVASSAGESSAFGRVRTLVLLLGAIAVAAYVVRQYVDRPEADPIDERDDDHVSIGVSEGASSDAIDGSETTVEMADSRSAAEIENRADRTQAEPGEMAVDEAIADELEGETDEKTAESEQEDAEDAADDDRA